jgi:hypothetical protein
MQKAKEKPKMLAQRGALDACPHIAGIYRRGLRNLGRLLTWWANSTLLVGPFLRELWHQGVVCICRHERRQGLLGSRWVLNT